MDEQRKQEEGQPGSSGNQPGPGSGQRSTASSVTPPEATGHNAQENSSTGSEEKGRQGNSSIPLDDEDTIGVP